MLIPVLIMSQTEHSRDAHLYQVSDNEKFFCTIIVCTAVDTFKRFYGPDCGK